MGALIFLLLITTRRIQKQSQLEAAAPVVAEVEELDPLPIIPKLPRLPLTVPNKIEPDPNEPLPPLMMSLTQADVDWEREQWERRQAARRAEHQLQLEAAHREQQRLHQLWQAKLSSARESVANDQEALERLQTEAASLKVELTEAQTLASSHSQQLADVQSQLEEARKLAEQQHATRATLTNAAIAVTQELARAEEDLQRQVGATEIVAYDSMSGTARKPIVIECTEREIRFASEGIVLNPIDLSGFPPEFNPLKAGTEALLNYWARNAEPSEKPYVLLVVRPGGTTAFYVARGLLSEMDHHFGYELVPEDLKLNWPKTDPEAIAECEQAVKTMLAERQRVAAMIGRGMARPEGPLDFVDEQGDFTLPDLEPSSQPRSNLYLDEKWIPPSKRQTFVEKPSLSQEEESPLPVPGRQYTDSVQSRELTQGDQSPSPVSEPMSSLNSLSTTPPVQTLDLAEDAPQLFPTVLSRPISEMKVEAGQDGAESQASSQPVKDPWELPSRRGDIGIERQIVLHLWPERIGIDNEFEIGIPPGTTAEAFQHGLTRAIRQYTDSWQPAPQSFFWKPTLKIVIHPGGNQHVPRIKQLSEQWKVSTRTEQAL